MNVRTVSLKGFMSHDKTEVKLDPGRTIVVTGANGAGKSTVIEAVSYTLWGKTLRGTDPWKGEHGEARIVLDVGERSLEVARTRRKGKVSLAWKWADDASPPTFETTTKAQEALEVIIGSWDVWRRSSVFSSQDAAHFTLATDAERKRLLEGILGIDRFDTALEACREDMRRAVADQMSASSARALVSEKLRSEERRRDDAQATLASLKESDEDTATLGAEVDRLGGLIDSTNRDIANARRSARELEGKAGAFSGTIAQLRATLERVRGEKCPTCTQSIDPKFRAKLEKDAQATQARQQAEADAVKDEVAALDAQIEELSEEVSHLVMKRSDLNQRLKSARSAAAAIANARTVVSEATSLIDKYREKLAEDETKEVEATAQVALLRAVEKVLGTKGVRAHVLGRALGGIEAVANGWLSRITGEALTVKITPYTEKKTGGVSDSIAIEITGAGNGLGYRAASGGERRRMDIALLLAIGEVAAAAHGRTGGTLFADEVFDTLDRAGVERVSAALDELAKQGRTVVVISHSETVVGALDADYHWTVLNGRLVA